MGRTPKRWTLVTLNSGSIDHETFTDLGALKTALGKLADGSEYVLVSGEPVPFRVSREPVVVIGEAKKVKVQKPRAKKPATLPEKKANGTHRAPAPEVREPVLQDD